MYRIAVPFFLRSKMSEMRKKRKAIEEEDDDDGSPSLGRRSS